MDLDVLNNESVDTTDSNEQVNDNFIGTRVINPFASDYEPSVEPESKSEPEIQDTEESTENNADTQETDGLFEDYPSFLPEDMVPEETYESSEKELEFYRNNYDRVIDFYKTEEFGKALSEHYEKELIAKEQEVDKVLAIKKALDGNPEEAFKKYFGKELAVYGYPSYINDIEGKEMVSDRMVETYGSDYLSKFNNDEANTPGTLSNRMLDLQSKVIAEIESHNREVESMVNASKSTKMTDEEFKVRLNKVYEEEFKPHGITREELDTFYNDTKDWKPTVFDMYLAHPVNREELMEAEYKRGLEDGRKNITNNIKKSTRKLPAMPNIIERNNNDDYEFDLNRNNNFSFINNHLRGGING